MSKPTQNPNLVACHRLPFGKHAGRSLADVPTDYLDWALRTVKLSSGLRDAVAGELGRRGVDAPPQLEPPPLPPCRSCGTAGAKVRWAFDRAGRRRLRADCRGCGRFLTFPPCVPPYTTAADAEAETGTGVEPTWAAPTKENRR